MLNCQTYIVLLTTSSIQVVPEGAHAGPIQGISLFVAK